MTGRRTIVSLACLLLCLAVLAQTTSLPSTDQHRPGHFAGWLTNGPAVVGAFSRTVTNIWLVPQPQRIRRSVPTNLPPEIRLRLLTNQSFSARGSNPPTYLTNLASLTNTVFDHYLPGSLNYLVWTNFIAHTNGRTTSIWRSRTHPLGWPGKPPDVVWNTTCLMWGMRGLTALSPCWQAEGYSGQVPITALTRRHGYTRGHDLGPEGFHANFAGQKVWFLHTNDSVVEVTILGEVVRPPASGRDYTILLFNRDLPASIEPMRVIASTNIFTKASKYAYCDGAPCPVFKTVQTGNVSADIPGFALNTFNGGDSGSPNMLPMPGELIFYSGRTTSGPSPQMQADMDELCRREGLDPKQYQMQWLDLSGYPSY